MAKAWPEVALGNVGRSTESMMTPIINGIYWDGARKRKQPQDSEEEEEERRINYRKDLTEKKVKIRYKARV